jgi:selenocysteine lyase/cysteine desulfurase
MVVHGLDLKEGDEVITDSLEFPTVVFPLLKLKKRGVIIKIVNTSLENFENDILSNFTNRTKLVSISHVSFNTGIRVDVKSIVKEAKRVGAYVLLDIIQSAGAINVDLRQLDVDFAVAGSYKWLMSPHGTGIFYVKKGLIKDPPLYGWKSTKNYLEFNPLFFELEEGPRRFEIGSNDLSAIAGLTKACEILSPIIDHVESRVMMLSKLVIELASELKLEVVTPLNKRAGIVVIKASNSKKIVERLQKENNIIVSPRGSGIRISTHFYNTEEEVRVTIEKLSNILNNI